MTDADTTPALPVPDAAIEAACREFGENAVTLHDDPEASVRAIAAPVVAAELNEQVFEADRHEDDCLDAMGECGASAERRQGFSEGVQWVLDQLRARASELDITTRETP